MEKEKKFNTILVPASGVSQENKDGNHIPAIPLPLYIGFMLRKSKCHCGKVFKKKEDYRGHYALEHILRTN